MRCQPLILGFVVLGFSLADDANAQWQSRGPVARGRQPYEAGRADDRWFDPGGQYDQSQEPDRDRDRRWRNGEGEAPRYRSPGLTATDPTWRDIAPTRDRPYERARADDAWFDPGRYYDSPLEPDRDRDRRWRNGEGEAPRYRAPGLHGRDPTWRDPGLEARGRRPYEWARADDAWFDPAARQDATTTLEPARDRDRRWRNGEGEAPRYRTPGMRVPAPNRWARPGRIERVALGAILNDTADGILVQTVDPGGPAQRAGLRRGDYLVEIDGRRLLVAADVDYVLQRLEPGARVGLTFERRGRTRPTVAVLEDRRTLFD